jgi:nucleoside-diphosphate-sugar epimerase
MRILILGGGDFVGRAVLDEAASVGHDVTTLTRTGTGAPDDRLGDRRSRGLDVLADDTWDAVIDTWSEEPIVVRRSAIALRGRAASYLYVSSRSVYAPPVSRGATEDAPLVDGDANDGDAVDYARAKRGGELAAAEFGDAVTLLRAGLILGPRENVGRLPWWLERMARGGDVVAPGPADSTFQHIDARDLARFALLLAAERTSGAFDVVAPAGTTTFAELLDACVEAVGSDARLHWVPAEAVLAAGARPWSDVPIWLPPGELHDSLHGSDVAKALSAGLSPRPIRQTVADTWSWMQRNPGVLRRLDRPRPGLSAEVESAILAASAL